MFNISVRRATETDYGLVSKNGKVLEFTTKEEAEAYKQKFLENKA